MNRLFANILLRRGALNRLLRGFHLHRRLPRPGDFLFGALAQFADGGGPRLLDEI
jgi:hypothetical protein